MPKINDYHGTFHGHNCMKERRTQRHVEQTEPRVKHQAETLSESSETEIFPQLSKSCKIKNKHKKTVKFVDPELTAMPENSGCKSVRRFDIEPEVQSNANNRAQNERKSRKEKLEQKKGKTWNSIHKSDKKPTTKDFSEDILAKYSKNSALKMESSSQNKVAKTCNIPGNDDSGLERPHAKVIQIEHAVEGNADPRPNAFMDYKNGFCRVYHGPEYGSPHASLSYIPRTQSYSDLPTGVPNSIQNQYWTGLANFPNPYGIPYPYYLPMPHWQTGMQQGVIPFTMINSAQQQTVKIESKSEKQVNDRVEGAREEPVDMSCDKKAGVKEQESPESLPKTKKRKNSSKNTQLFNTTSNQSNNDGKADLTNNVEQTKNSPKKSGNDVQDDNWGKNSNENNHEALGNSNSIEWDNKNDNYWAHNNDEYNWGNNSDNDQADSNNDDNRGNNRNQTDKYRKGSNWNAEHIGFCRSCGRGNINNSKNERIKDFQGSKGIKRSPKEAQNPWDDITSRLGSKSFPGRKSNNPSMPENNIRPSVLSPLSSKMHGKNRTASDRVRFWGPNKLFDSGFNGLCGCCRPHSYRNEAWRNGTQYPSSAQTRPTSDYDMTYDSCTKNYWKRASCICGDHSQKRTLCHDYPHGGRYENSGKRRESQEKNRAHHCGYDDRHHDGIYCHNEHDYHCGHHHHHRQSWHDQDHDCENSRSGSRNILRYPSYEDKNFSTAIKLSCDEKRNASRSCLSSSSTTRNSASNGILCSGSMPGSFPASEDCYSSFQDLPGPTTPYPPSFRNWCDSSIAATVEESFGVKTAPRSLARQTSGENTKSYNSKKNDCTNLNEKASPEPSGWDVPSADSTNW